jgi:hypothetical protein
VNIKWVKAHNGTGGNEEADKLAKEGAKLSKMQETNYKYNLLPLSFVKTKIEDSAWKEWHNDLITNKTYSDRAKLNEYTKKYIPDKPLKCIKFTRLADYYTTQFITGHGHFANYKEDFKITQNGHKKCIQCKTEQDSPNHALFYCKENDDLREELHNSEIDYIDDLKEIVLDKGKCYTFKRAAHEIIKRRTNIE